MNQPVTFELNWQKRGPLNPIWSFGANTCHAPLWLRDDLQNHISTCRDQLGFTRLRAHGTIGDGMGTVQEKGSFSFDKLLTGLTRLLDSGQTPFFEISHMPRALAAGDENVCHYRFGAAPPRDWEKWREFVDSMIAALVKKFGHKELRKWDFEVWNEPDIAFWAGTQEEYFRLYDITAAAIKKADPQFRVGGPATARCQWIEDFLKHLSKPSREYPFSEKEVPRCNFISTHAYPSDLEFLDAAEGEVTLQESGVMKKLFAETRETVNQYRNPEFPIICGEWNSSAGPLATNHDECNNAAFICKTLIELSDPFGPAGTRGICQGSLYWNLSDIYEECDFHYQPFHGGYGLMNVNNIAKSSFRGFEMLHKHSGSRIPISWSKEAPASLGGLATTDAGRTLITIWYSTEPNQENQPVDLKFKIPGNRIMGRSILPGEGSAYEKWLELDKPQFPTTTTLQALEKASRVKTFTLNENSEGETELTIAPGTVHQLEITS